MEEYKLINVIEVKNDNFKGYCCNILIYNSLNPMQMDIIYAYINEEQKAYLSNYSNNESEVPVKDLFKVVYDFYKKKYTLKFNSNLIK